MIFGGRDIEIGPVQGWLTLAVLLLLPLLVWLAPNKPQGQVLRATPRPLPAQAATTPGPTTPVVGSPELTAQPTAAAAAGHVPIKEVRAAVTVAPATPDIAPLSACPGQQDPSGAALALSCMVAYARSYHGLASAESNDALTAAATAKVADMGACGYSHTACGRPFDYWIRLKGFGGNCSAENIAAGQPTPRAVFEGWMKSAGHRENILNPSYRFVGVATAPHQGGQMWAMYLGGCV